MKELLNKIHLCDCMDLMAQLPDKCIDLAIVDPPYGIGACNMNLGEGGGVYRQPKTYKKGNWDNKAPDVNYFNKLKKVSKNQIIWGANHFISKIPFDSSCWIFWDKNNGGSDFADGELAWTSFDKPVRKFKFTWSGFIQENMGRNKEKRIHPTQKPVALYRWLLQNYAKECDIILDTHCGSGSSVIACIEEGFQYIACELDPDYHRASLERIQPYLDQGKLW
jgi:site-specific DNA-methyltransferase (adenine-specific)